MNNNNDSIGVDDVVSASSGEGSVVPPSLADSLKFVNGFISFLMASESLETGLRKITERPLPAFCGDWAAVYLKEKADANLRLAASACGDALGLESSVSRDSYLTAGDGLLLSPLVCKTYKEGIGSLATARASGAVTSEPSLQSQPAPPPFAHEDDEHVCGALQPRSPFLSELAVPIRLQGEIVGVVSFASLNADYFQTYHLELADSLALSIANKMANSRAIGRLQESVLQLEHAERVQTALYEISALSHAARDLDELYQQLYRIVRNLIYTRNFYIALIDPVTKSVTFPFFVDEKDPEFEDQVIDFGSKEKASLTGYLLKEKKPLLILPGRFEETCQRQGIEHIGSTPTAWLGAPFFLDQLSGAVVVQSYDEQVSFSRRDEELLVYVASHVGDALERKRSDQRLRHQAMHDLLTGLPNRMLFYDRLKVALARHHRDNNYSVIIFFLDLDSFKSVNDRFGHLIGDQLLKESSQAIAGCLRESDTLARFGGDEFAVLLEDLGLEEACRVAGRIGKVLQSPFDIEGHRIETSTSIGIAYAEPETRQPDDMIGRADRAMYQAKALGPGRHQIFTGS